MREIEIYVRCWWIGDSTWLEYWIVPPESCWPSTKSSPSLHQDPLPSSKSNKLCPRTEYSPYSSLQKSYKSSITKLNSSKTIQMSFNCATTDVASRKTWNCLFLSWSGTIAKNGWTDETTKASNYTNKSYLLSNWTGRSSRNSHRAWTTRQ